MKQIWFKSKFYNPIKTGQKTQTIRLWKRKPTFQIGEIFECFFGFNNPKLIGKIENISEKIFKELTEEEIKKDGYNCKNTLHDNLKDYYPDFNIDSQLYIIRFSLNE